MITSPPVAATSLAAVKLQFKAWRETRKHRARIPDELWNAAVSLSGRYSINHISRALHLNHSALRDRILASKPVEDCKAQTCFVELPLTQSSPVQEWLIEMENGSGDKMRMHFCGKNRP